jgi:hypothetical protein
MVEFNPTSTAALMVQPSVLEVSPTGLIPLQASLSIQPMVEVTHRRFYLYGSESGNNVSQSLVVLHRLPYTILTNFYLWPQCKGEWNK